MRVNYTVVFTECAKAGKSVSKAFTDAGISTCVLANIKAGKNVTSVTVGKLAKALNIPVEQLLKVE